MIGAAWMCTWLTEHMNCSGTFSQRALRKSTGTIHMFRQPSTHSCSSNHPSTSDAVRLKRLLYDPAREISRFSPRLRGTRDNFASAGRSFEQPAEAHFHRGSFQAQDRFSRHLTHHWTVLEAVAGTAAHDPDIFGLGMAIQDEILIRRI